MNDKSPLRALTECDFLGSLVPDLVQIHPRPSSCQDKVIKKREKVDYAEPRTWDELPSASSGKGAGMLHEQIDFSICALKSSFN